MSLEGRVYLPLFYDLTGKTVLVVGGGKAALQKLRALEPFGAAVRVVSPAILAEVQDLASERVELVLKAWDEGDFDTPGPGGPVGLVLACTADPAVQEAVTAAGRRRGIPVLDAAVPARGDFVQPACARADGFTLAVSSGGVGPRAAVAVRNALRPAFEAAVRGALTPQEEP